MQGELTFGNPFQDSGMAGASGVGPIDADNGSNDTENGSKGIGETSNGSSTAAPEDAAGALPSSESIKLT